MYTVTGRAEALQSEEGCSFASSSYHPHVPLPACISLGDGSKLSHFSFQDKLRTGEKAVVCFRFIKHPEYLKIGAKLLFREGVTKGIGHVTNLQAITTKENGLEESLGPGQLSF